MNIPDQSIIPFLSFNGKAEEAMKVYVSALPGAQIETLELYEEGNPAGDVGTVYNGQLLFRGQRILFLDMPKAYPSPESSWSTSLFIPCQSEVELRGILDILSVDGTIMMGPEPVGDMRLCTWVIDRFGVTWQLVWA